MTTEDYRRAFETAKREFEALGDQRREIDRRLSQLAQTMASLSRLCGYVPTVSWGLTDGCRMVLMASGRPMVPTEVRDALVACGFDLSKYVNDLAAIHTVLKRLNETGELRFIAQESGKHAYVYSAARSWPVFGRLTGGRPVTPVVLSAEQLAPTATPSPVADPGPTATAARRAAAHPGRRRKSR
jgi:hypothetical protein